MCLDQVAQQFRGNAFQDLADGVFEGDWSVCVLVWCSRAC